MTGKTRGRPTGRRGRSDGLYVIPLTDVVFSDMEDAPDHPEIGQELHLGRWPGRLDTTNTRLVLEGADGVAQLHERAARIARILARQTPQPDPILPDPDEAPLRGGMVLTDGRTAYPCTLIDGPPRLLAFHGRHPGPGTPLWVARVDGANRPRRPSPPTLLGLTEDTPVATPDGPRPAMSLRAGDLVLTRDHGARPLRWIGHHRLEAAQLLAMPSLRPLRIAASALGIDRPDGDLSLSPGHRVLVSGPAARKLFQTREVLVGLQHLRDLPGIGLDLRPGAVTYVHLALDTQDMLCAAGLWVESFDAARADLSALGAANRAALFAAFPELRTSREALGPPARRVLSLSEAAILRHRMN